MNKQLTVLEFIRVAVALAVFHVIYFAVSELSQQIPWDDQSYFIMIMHICAYYALPPFLGILIACVIPSWRYKTIAATFMLLLNTVDAFSTVLVRVFPLEYFLGWMVRYGIWMSGPLVAVLIWNGLKARHDNQSIDSPATVTPAEKQPRTNPVLFWTSLLSVPVSYIAVIAASFIVVGFSVLLYDLLSYLPMVPVILLIIATVAPLAAISAGFYSLWKVVRPTPSYQIARPLQLSDHPHMKSMIEEVCDRVDTRVPDNVLLHAKPTFYVSQARVETLTGIVKGRSLALGLPLLQYLTDEETKVVLAHEFAHFTGRDTLYSVFVSGTYRSLGLSIEQLYRIAGSFGWWAGLVSRLLLLPAILYLSAIYTYFASLDALISRTRELRADWIAVNCYGKDVFVSAMEKIVAYGAHFGAHFDELDMEDAESVFEQYRDIVAETETELQEHLDESLEEVEKVMDSHPTLSTRIASVPDIPSAFSDGESSLVTELLDDEEELAESLSSLDLESLPIGAW